MLAHGVLLAVLGSGLFVASAAAADRLAMHAAQSADRGSSPIYAVAFAPNGDLAVSGSCALIREGLCVQGLMKLWEVSTRKLLREFRDDVHFFESVVFSTDGRFVLSCSCDHRPDDDPTKEEGYCIKGSIKLLEVSTGKVIRDLPVNTRGVPKLAFSSDGHLALTSSDNNSLALLELPNGNTLRHLSGHSDIAKALAFSPDSRSALSSSYDGTVKLWDIASGKELRSIQRPDGPETVVFSPDSRFALSANNADSTVTLWEVNSGRDIGSLTGHSDTVLAAAFSADGHFALTGGVDKTLKLWDLSSLETLRTFRGHEDTIRSVALSPDGRLALSGSDDGTLRLWDAKNGHEMAKLIHAHKER